jgi:hypothetical protein
VRCICPKTALDGLRLLRRLEQKSEICQDQDMDYFRGADFKFSSLLNSYYYYFYFSPRPAERPPDV